MIVWAERWRERFTPLRTESIIKCSPDERSDIRAVALRMARMSPMLTRATGEKAVKKGHAQPGTPASDGVAGRHHAAIFTRMPRRR
jgi:hypothetical protein